MLSEHASRLCSPLYHHHIHSYLALRMIRLSLLPLANRQTKPGLPLKFQSFRILLKRLYNCLGLIALSKEIVLVYLLLYKMPVMDLKSGWDQEK